MSPFLQSMTSICLREPTAFRTSATENISALGIFGDRSIHQVQTEQVQLNKTIEQKISWTKIYWTKSQLSKWISEQIFDWSNTHWTNASEQNYRNNWTNVELNKLSKQGYPQAPPGGMRSGAQRHEARGVWGACPHSRKIQTMSSGGCNNFLEHWQLSFLDPNHN